jgi:hypothetical protein
MLSRKIPESCRSVDLDAAGRELIRAGGVVSRAATALGVDRRDFRQLVYAHPELLDAALEAEALALDEAWEVVLAAMRTGNMRRRSKAAGFVLRNTEAGRRRFGG